MSTGPRPRDRLAGALPEEPALNSPAPTPFALGAARRAWHLVQGALSWRVGFGRVRGRLVLDDMLILHPHSGQLRGHPLCAFLNDEAY